MKWIVMALIVFGCVLYAVIHAMSREAAGIVLGLLFGLLSVVPGTVVILAHAGSEDRAQVQRPAPPTVYILPAPPRALLTDGRREE